MPNDGESYSWTCEGTLCSENGSADTRSGQVSGCPVVAKTECTVPTILCYVTRIYDSALLIMKVSHLC